MDIHWHEVTSSTNDEAQKLIQDGAPHGTLVGADYQQKGRGRSGNQWQCSPGQGLMCSLILYPQWSRTYWGWIALGAALALCEVLERDCLSPQIKWPNDILIKGRKIAGVLTEVKDEAVIVGVGVNLNMKHVPTVASGLQPTSFLLETDCTLQPQAYARTIQSHLVQIMSADSPLLLREQITQRIAWLGEQITLQTKTEEMDGRIVGLGDYGQLLLEQGAQTREVYDAFHIRKV